MDLMTGAVRTALVPGDGSGAEVIDAATGAPARAAGRPPARRRAPGTRMTAEDLHTSFRKTDCQLSSALREIVRTDT